MRYDLSNPFHAEQARARLEKLISRGATADITEKVARTRDQNSYLHLAIRYIAICIGEDADYVKEKYYKRHCNRDLYLREKYDKVLRSKVAYLRSSRELTKEEMSLSIDRFRTFAVIDLGEYIPSPDDHRMVQAMETEVERVKQYAY